MVFYKVVAACACSIYIVLCVYVYLNVLCLLCNGAIGYKNLKVKDEHF